VADALVMMAMAVAASATLVHVSSAKASRGLGCEPAPEPARADLERQAAPLRRLPSGSRRCLPTPPRESGGGLGTVTAGELVGKVPQGTRAPQSMCDNAQTHGTYDQETDLFESRCPGKGCLTHLAPS